MDRTRAIELLSQLRPSLEARGVAHAGLFGSVARGEARKASDVDVVITPQPGKRLDLFDLGAVQEMLEKHFGAAIDVVVEPVRSDTLRAAIGRERVNAF